VTPSQLETAAHKIYGRKKWKPSLARDLGVDTSTIFRIMHREQVPGPVEVAVKGLLQNRLAQIKIDKEARRLLSRKLKRKKIKPPKRQRLPQESAGS
jgi:hypothetical protein